MNGGWLTRTEIPADKPAYGGFYEAYDRTQEQLKVLVEAAAGGQHAPGSDSQKIGDFFTSFMDEARADGWASTPLAPELTAIEALSTKADLARYFAHQAKLGIGGAPLGAGVDGDAKDPTRNALYLGQGGIGLPDRDYYLKNDAKLKEYRAEYVAYITTVLAAAQVPDPAQGRGRHPGLRDAAGPRALDQRREPRRGEDLQQGGARRPAEASSPGSTGRPGSASSASPRRRRSSLRSPAS